MLVAQLRLPREPDGEGPQLQGQDRQGPGAEHGAVRLPRAPGGRHPHLRRQPRARRPGPEAARRDDPRPGGQVQPGLRQEVLVRARAVHRRRRSPSCPASTGRRCPRATTTPSRSSRPPKQTKKRCAQIVTDSTPLEDPKDPDTCNVFALLKLFATPEELDEIAGKYRAGGYGYGHAKGRLAELINETFAEARERYAELDRRPGHVRDSSARAAGRPAKSPRPPWPASARPAG